GDRRRRVRRGPPRGVDSCGSSHRPELAWRADLPLACLGLSPPFPYLGWVIQRAYTRPEVTADSPFVGAKFRDHSILPELAINSLGRRRKLLISRATTTAASLGTESR